MTKMHLAEINVGLFRYPTDDPRMADFMNNLDRVNGLAERMPGFVWRLKDDTGNATDIEVPEHPGMAVNLSVWEDVASLENFVWNTVHKRFYERRAEWFALMDSMHHAMWWVEPGTEPTVAEAMERLAHYDAHGNTDRAFGWDYLDEAVQWRDRRCASLAAE